MIKIICGKIIDTDNYDKDIPDKLILISAEKDKDAIEQNEKDEER